jgi:DNA-binding transcriptional regulator YdaS (Cro superfamily)
MLTLRKLFWILRSMQNQTFQSFLEAEYGRSSRLARHLGISKNMVWRYKTKRLPIPSRHINQILAFAKGELDVKQLLPEA